MVGVAVLQFGCVHDDQFSSRNLRQKPVITPDLGEASVAVAARVDTIGQELLAMNPLLGVEPLFQTVSISEPLVVRLDDRAIMVSEGLVEQCENDEELAAVLAHQLGQMAAEKEAAAKYRLPDRPIPVPQATGGNMNAGGVSSDQVQLAELARFEQKHRGPQPNSERLQDGGERAAEILRASGYSDKTLPKVEPLIRKATENQKLAPGFAPRSVGPRWSP